MNHDYIITTDGELYHYGVKGMKWGVRKYRNKDGSLTPAGQKRYDSAGDVESAKAAYKSAGKAYNKAYNKAHNKAFAAYSPIKKHRQANDKRWEEAYNKAEELNKAKTALKDAKFKQKVDSDRAKPSAELRKKSRSAHIENARQHTSASNTIKYTKAAAIGSASAIGTAVIGSAATHMLAKNGKTQAASTVYKLSRTAFDAAKMYSQVSAGAAFMSAAMTSKESMRDYRAEEKRIREKYGS